RRGPRIGGPTVMPANLVRRVALDAAGFRRGRGVFDAVMFLGRRLRRAGPAHERQAPDRRRRAPPAALHADVDVLTRRPTDLHGNPPAAAEPAAGEAHERAHRGVLSIE